MKLSDVLLVTPLHVIRSWFDPSQALDKTLHGRPETQHLQRVVQPPCSDAEVRLMGCDVMDTMVFTG